MGPKQTRNVALKAPTHNYYTGAPHYISHCVQTYLDILNTLTTVK